MRTLFALALVAGLAAAAPADDTKKADPPAKKAAPKKAEPTLKVGDKAPALKADTWLQGDEVKGFESGKVYVVEFWQTWCGPCIVMMPHLADLADEYKAKGVTVIGYAAVLGGDKPAAVAEFVKKRGPKLGYTFAGSDDMETFDAWMKAAGQSGIPCSFVVDQQGQIAYIGHPMYLDEVLPAVVAGTWDPAKGAAVAAAAQKDFVKAVTASRNDDPAAGLEAFDKVLAGRPALADVPYLLAPRLGLLVKNKQFDQARAVAEKVVAKAPKRGDVNALRTVRAALLVDAAKGDKGLVGLAVTAAEQDRAMTGADDPGAVVRLAAAYSAAGDPRAKELAVRGVGLAEKALTGDKDWQGHLLLAAAHDAAGDKEQAKAAAAKAVTAAGSQRGLKEYVAEEAKKYGAEPAGDKQDK